MTNNLVNLVEEKFIRLFEILVEQSQEKFSNISCCPISSWNDKSWFYLGKESINFSEKGDPDSVIGSLEKVFLVNYLWNSRFRKNYYSHSHVASLIVGAKALAAVGVNKIVDIGQENYLRAIDYIHDKYAQSEKAIYKLNAVVAFLQANNLLVRPIDTVSAKSFVAADEYGRINIESKMPIPELVSAIIGLKRAVERAQDGTPRAVVDELSILTQIFQYGLGLRIGEVLRLPKDCIVESDGNMYCRVWTEKGAVPSARYVPVAWRPAITETVRRIGKLTQSYREQAVSIETGIVGAEYEQRFQKRIQGIEDELSSLNAKLERYLAVRRQETASRLCPNKEISDDQLISLVDLGKYLPVYPATNNASTLYRFAQNNGLQITSILLGKIKKKHFVLGKDLKHFMENSSDLAGRWISYKEVFNLIHDYYPAASNTSSAIFKKFTKTLSLGSLAFYAFTGSVTTRGGRCVVMSHRNALSYLKFVVTGGYDYHKYIPLVDAESLFPELFNQKTMTYLAAPSPKSFFSFLKISNAPQVFSRSIKETNERKVSYVNCNGYLLEFHSIAQAVEHQFVGANSEVQAELIKGIRKELLADGIRISSAALSISQKVSHYLFITPSSLGGYYNESIPCVMGFFTVKYSLNPSKEGARSAFSRYGVDVSPEVINTFQTHKGRHWQTNSLFRAGLASSIANKWLGRSDDQGAHYDHRTAKERASSVGELMLREQSRFLGAIPERIKSWNAQSMSMNEQTLLLDMILTTAHYSPLGYCLRDVNLRPCEYHLKCLTGNKGHGCREFVFDLHDPVQRQKVRSERDKAEHELSRLFEVLNLPSVPAESVEMHIEHHMSIFRNASSVLDKSEIILTEDQSDAIKEFKPFALDGSKPDGCVIQCGGYD